MAESTLFERPQGEEDVCRVLKALVEEFGAEEVVVKLPTTWTNENYTLGRTKLVFNTLNSVEVAVPRYHVNYVEPLKASR